jgi:hypothetical protein
MRRSVHLSFGAGKLPWSDVCRILLKAGCTELAAQGENVLNHYAYAFAVHDPRLEILRQTLSERPEIRWSERIEHEYTPAELRAAVILEASVNRAPRDTGDFAYREQFDFSKACPACGTGAVQIKALIVNEGALPKKALMCQTLNGEYLLAEPVARELIAEKLSGADLVQIASRRGKALPWWQILPRHQMPPFLPETRGTTRGTPPGEICSDTPCERCHRDGYFSNNREPIQLVYDGAALGGGPLPDVAHTYEHFGCSVLREPFSESQLAKPLLLIGPRVFDVFHRTKVRGLVFEPVVIRGG